MPTARFQPSFGGGVIGPSLYGRIDTQKYDVGLKVGFNCFIHVHGGGSNRAGTEWICEVPDHTVKHRLIPFARSESENFVLLFGENTMRVIENGAVIQDDEDDYVAATPFSAAVAVSMDYAQSIDVTYFADQSFFPQKMSRFDNTNWTFENLNIDPIVGIPAGVGIATNFAGTETYEYVVSAIFDGVEGFQSATQTILSRSLDVAGTEITLTWTAVADTEYNIYKSRNGVFGFVGFSENGSFVDDNISPNLQVTPKKASEVFETSDDYPKTVTLFQQRLMFGGSVNEPETILGSRIGDFENFTRSRTILADDRITATFSTDGISEVQSFLQLRQLLIFTTLGEYSLDGPDGVLVATNPIQTQFGYSGSNRVNPLVVEDTALFVDRTGRQVRDLRYAFEQDGYSGNDLTVFAYHYFEKDKIAGWAYSKNPYYVVWVYLESGRLLSLTYKREHQVWAWCDHDLSGGLVEQAVVIREGDYDALYMIVKRTVNGSEVRYVERMENRQFNTVEESYFLDCGVKYNGTSTTTIDGLDHLEGETVVALADGNVIPDLVVSGGAVELNAAASIVSVGLPYFSELETLPPAIELPEVGSSRGRPTKVNRVFIQVDRTRGIKAGYSRDKLNEIIQTKQDLSLPIETDTKMIEITVSPNWNREGTIIVRQDFPLPMTVLGVSPETTVGRSE